MITLIHIPTAMLKKIYKETKQNYKTIRTSSLTSLIGVKKVKSILLLSDEHFCQNVFLSKFYLMPTFYVSSKLIMEQNCILNTNVTYFFVDLIIGFNSIFSFPRSCAALPDYVGIYSPSRGKLIIFRKISLERGKKFHLLLQLKTCKM